VVFALDNPFGDIVWVTASDPLQAWGKYLPHALGKQFSSLPGTAVALCAGTPVALFERQGQTLRVFDDEALPAALRAFIETHRQKLIFPGQRKITVKQFPEGTEKALADAGFTKVMMDYVLYA